jgi:hypothetical protein
MDNCSSVTQNGGNEISKTGVDWFLAVLETPKKKVGGLQWRKSGLKSGGGTNPWRALEVLKNDKNLGDNLNKRPPHCHILGGFVPPSPRDLRPWGPGQ